MERLSIFSSKLVRIACLFLVVFSSVSAIAQTYPVSLSTSVLPPYPIYKEDITDPFNGGGWLITMTFNDFGEPSRDVYINVKIESDLLSVTTNRLATTLPSFTLFPGIPTQVSTIQLEEYLAASNINVSGSYASQFNTNARFPDGLYQFCIEVVDVFSGEILSQESCSQVWIQQNDQPVLNSPMCESVIDPEINNNIFFQWQLFGNLSPNSFSNTEYQLTLYEITGNTDLPPASAISNGQVVLYYQSQWSSTTTIVYDISFPALNKGKMYIWQVQAKDLSGRDVFKNNGFSEACWFAYGYPEEGRITLKYPANKTGFAKTDPQYFDWSGPDNMLANQSVEYTVTIKEKNEGQTIDDAFRDNEVWYLHTTERLYQDEGFDFYLDPSTKKLESAKQYCWQVEAFTGEQKIAESEIFEFLGPPFLESFYVDLYKVTVTKLFSNDLSDLSGEGKVIITEDQQEVTITFDNLKLVNVAGRYYVDEGVIFSELDRIIPLEINAQNESNESATANIHALKLSKNGGLQVQAIIDWEFYLPAIENDVTVSFNDDWYLYNLYELSGITSLDKNYTYNLLEPLGFEFNLSFTTEFVVQQNTFYTKFDGHVKLPEEVEDEEGNEVNYYFSDQDQLYYMTETNDLGTQKILAVKGVNNTIQPVNYTFDFSDYQSPFAFNDDQYWKGLFIDKYQFIFEEQERNDITLTFDAQVSVLKTQQPTGNNELWITHNGLHFVITEENLASEEEGVEFNTFPANLYAYSLEVDKSRFVSGTLNGGIKIPVISDEREFPFEIPLNFLGYTDGYLTEDLQGQRFTFNPEGGEQQIFIDIKRAVFREKNHLEMDLNLEWPAFGVVMEQVDYFCVWGNYDIGFVKPNGIASLKQQVKGKASGYDITMEYIGAGRQANLYSFGSKASIVMGEDVSGDDGAPTINAYSIVESSTIPETYVSTYTPPTEVEDINAENLFEIINSGEGMDIETEYTNDFKALLYGINEGLNAKGKDEEEEESKDSLVDFKNGTEEDSSANYINVQELITSMYKVLDIAVILSDNEEQKAKLLRVKEMLTSYEESELSEILNSFIENGFDYKKVIQAQIQKLVEKLNSNIENKIGVAKNKIKVVVYKPVDALMRPIDTQIDKSVDVIIDVIAAIVGSSDSASAVLRTLRISTKATIKVELSNAVYGSVDTNVLAPISNAIDTIITENITSFISEEATALGASLLVKDQDNSEAFQQLFNNSAELLNEIGDDLVTQLATINTSNIERATRDLVEDAYNNINWQRVGDKIKADVLKAVEAAVLEAITEEISEAFSELLGDGSLGSGIVDGLLANVDLDFSNLGEKLKNGDLSGIIKFDPTKISVKSDVVEFDGMLTFKKDDPVWGDSWAATVNAKVKKPKEFHVNAEYINGITRYTGEGEYNFNYWFLEIAAPSGLQVPIMASVLMDGVGGKVYNHMLYDTEKDEYLPHSETKFGVRFEAFLVDGIEGAPRNALGNTVRMNVGMEVIILEDYFSIGIDGDVGVGFPQELDKGTDYGKCLVTGSGFLNYNSKEEHLLGEFDVTFNTSPLLCAGGTMGMSIKKDYWNVYVGKRTTPVYAKILCKELATFNAWFDLSTERFEVGLKQDIEIYAKGPWITVANKGIQPFAGFGYHFLAEVQVRVKPSLKLEEAVLELAAHAEIGAFYDKDDASRKWVLAGAYLSGVGRYKNTNEVAYIMAAVSGKIVIVGIGVDVSMDVYKEL